MDDLSHSTVLIVDDTEANIDILVEALGQHYEISVATDGEGALNIVESDPPDLILLDVMMPGIDGYETCLRLKNDLKTKNIPVIFITGKTETEDIVKGFQVGGVDYIAKPFQQEEVLARVRTHLQLKFLSKQREIYAAKLEQTHNELLEYATLVQKGFLPEEPPRHPKFEFAGMTSPAKLVGGDFYDFIPLGENQLGILVGDVSGKGVNAALYMAKLVSDFRQICQMDPKPKSVMENINRILCERSKLGMFATAIYLLLNLEENTLTVSNAGHFPILFCDKGNKVVEKGKAGSVPLGILPNTKYPQEEIRLDHEELGLLFTDGAIEPTNSDRGQFGLKRMRHFLSENHSPPQTLIKNLHEAIADFSENSELPDDLTLLAFKLK